MEFLIPSFLAGVLTVLAPCVLSLLPIILSGTLGQQSPWRPLIITASLGVSVIIFSLLLRASTAIIDIPEEFWRYLSGGLITIFGITMVLPSLWEKIAFKLKLYKSENLISGSQQTGGTKGAIP